jgi:hypothetical protein
MHPLLYAFSQAPAQDRPPVNPDERPLANLIPELLAEGTPPAIARYLATLPVPLQHLIYESAQTEIPGKRIERIPDLVSTIMELALTPGNPTPEDIREAIADMLDIRPGTPFTDDELNEARSRIQGGGGTDAPEPTDEQLYNEASAARREALLERGLITPTDRAQIYSPGEQIPEPPTPEE